MAGMHAVALEEQIGASETVTAEERRAAALAAEAGRHEPGLSGSGVPADVLAKLLPGDDVVELPEPRVAGGPAYRIAKRAFDVVSCGCALVVLAVPMALVALKIKSESPGPVIYAQERVGRGGRVFKVYKFRSMYVDAEARGAQWAQGDDPRVTPFGRFMRKTRLDEVPQFWNVVKGDIPSRILKTRPGHSAKIMGAFTLPAKSSRNDNKAFSQVDVAAVAGLRIRRVANLRCNLTCSAEPAIFADPFSRRWQRNG